MTSIRKVIERAGAEDGASLVLALVFLTLFGLSTAALLGLVDTGLIAGTNAHAQAGQLFAVDGAADAAINQLRGTLSLTDSGSTCPSYTASDLNGVPVLVKCTAEPGVLGSGYGVNPANKPARAILTLAEGAEEGIVQGSNANLKIHGDVFSRSTIANSASSAEFHVDGTVDAIGNCSGNITATATRVPAIRCANRSGPVPAADQAAATDPGYAYAADLSGTLSNLQNAPTCGAGTVITLQPGWYSSAASLSGLMSGACTNKTFHFAPGTYYFNFRDAGSHEWVVADANAILVGGTRRDPSVARPAIPGACDPAQPGVQFVFGGDSRMKVTAGKIELCATPATNSQQIALYGLTSGTITPASPTVKANATPAATPAGSFTSPDNARNIGETPLPLTSDGTVTTASPTATLKLTYGNPLPPGSVLQSATLRVTHRETGDVKRLTSSKIDAGTASQALALNLNTSASLAQQSFDLTSFFQSDATRLSNFSVSYTADVSNGGGKTGKTFLDGIELAVTYLPPGLEGQNGCLTQAPYSLTNPATCALINTSGAQTTFVLQGTVYAPKSVLDVSLTNVSTQIFGRGIVARSLRVSITPAALYDGPTIQIPDDSSSGVDNRTATLRACRIVGADCAKDASGNDIVLLTTKVRFAAALSGGSNPQVLSWDVVR